MGYSRLFNSLNEYFPISKAMDTDAIIFAEMVASRMRNSSQLIPSAIASYAGLRNINANLPLYKIENRTDAENKFFMHK